LAGNLSSFCYGFLSQAFSIQAAQHNSLIFFDATRMGRAAELGLCQCSAVKHMEGFAEYCHLDPLIVCAMLLLFPPSAGMPWFHWSALSWHNSNMASK